MRVWPKLGLFLCSEDAMMTTISKIFHPRLFLACALFLVSSAGFCQQLEEAKGADNVPSGRELINIDFPELTDIKDIIKAVALWTGKNVILDRNVTGKVQIISPRKVTKEEAYQAFLSALNMLNLTTVETGKVIKIMKVRNAVRDNLKTYMGSSWAPRTDEVITQIIPLKYIDSKQVQSTLARIVSSNAMIAYEPTNTLIISDSGYKVRRVLEILELLDVQTQQPKVLIVPIKHSDPKSITDKVNQILQARGVGKGKASGGGFNSYKIITDERTNSVIIFGPPRAIRDVKELVKKFDIRVDDPSAQASIHVRPLDYADAKKLAATLSSLASGSGNRNSSVRRPPVARSGSSSTTNASVADLGDGVKITADESSNSLLITGSRSAYDALNSIIRKLDIRRSQVFVEADILDLNENNDFTFGTSIFAGAGNEDGSGAKQVIGWEASRMSPLVVAGSTAAAGNQVSSAEKEKVAGAFAQNMTIGIISGNSVTVPGLGQFTPGALIDLIKTDANTKVLSSPHILTANNEEASITVGEKVFFNSTAINPSTGTPIPKVEKENVDLTLSLKPNISHSNYVTLSLELESSSISGFSPDGLPQVSKRKTKQNVTVKNGQTVVVSGLVKTFESERYSKIPLLGDIPILGWLFRNSNITKSRSNLVVFLTPHVVHGAQDLAAIYQKKLKDRDNYLAAVYGDDFKEDEFYGHLPTEKQGAYKPDDLDQLEDRKMEAHRADVYKAIGFSEDKEEAKAIEVDETPTTVPIDISTDSGVSSPDPIASEPDPVIEDSGIDEADAQEEPLP